MKFAVVLFPDHAECEVRVTGEKPPRVMVIGRGKQLAVLFSLLLCASALVATEYSSPERIASAFSIRLKALAEPAAPAVSPVPQRTMGNRFDGSQILKAGDLVIMEGTKAPKVRPIAAEPHQTVLLRRGNALHALYLARDNGAALLLDNGSRIMPSAQIRAVVEPVSFISSF